MNITAWPKGEKWIKITKISTNYTKKAGKNIKKEKNKDQMFVVNCNWNFNVILMTIKKYIFSTYKLNKLPD